jgi:hypothetical protein
MLVVYHARSLQDARSACELLTGRGIPAHIADQALWEVAGQRQEADEIRIFVDNRRLDQARRVIQAWIRDRRDDQD